MIEQVKDLCTVEAPPKVEGKTHYGLAPSIKVWRSHGEKKLVQKSKSSKKKPAVIKPQHSRTEGKGVVLHAFWWNFV